MTISAAEIAALISAFGLAAGAIGGVIVGIINARHNAGLMDQQKKEYEAALEASNKKHDVETTQLRMEIFALKEHNRYQDSVAIDRESELIKLQTENKDLKDKIAKWHDWGITIGQMLNQQALEIGRLTQGRFKTGPLPTMPNAEPAD